MNLYFIAIVGSDDRFCDQCFIFGLVFCHKPPFGSHGSLGIKSGNLIVVLVCLALARQHLAL